MQALSVAAPAIGMLGVFALVAGGLWLLAKGAGQADRRKGVLMLVLALVIFGNVLIMTL